MKLHLLERWDRSHPAIEHLEWYQRQHVLELARRHTEARWGFWLAMLGGPLLLLVLAMVSANLTNLPLPAVTGPLVAIALVGAATWQILTWRLRARRMFLHSLRVVLLAEGIRPAVCLVCEYDLRGCPSDRCPECGASLGMASVLSPPHAPE